MHKRPEQKLSRNMSKFTAGLVKNYRWKTQSTRSSGGNRCGSSYSVSPRESGCPFDLGKHSALPPNRGAVAPPRPLPTGLPPHSIERSQDGLGTPMALKRGGRPAYVYTVSGAVARLAGARGHRAGWTDGWVGNKALERLSGPRHKPPRARETDGRTDGRTY